MKKFVLGGSFVLIVAILLGRFVPLPFGTNAGNGDGTTGKRADLPAISVLSVRPGIAAPGETPRTPAATAKPLPVISANLSQFRARKDYATLYRNIQRDKSPEALYLTSEIYARCARPEGKTAQDLAQEIATKKAKFLTSISQTNADTPRRIEAFDQLYSDPCAGLDLGTFDKQEFARLAAAAANAGDVRAQAAQLADRIERAYYDGNGSTPYQVTEADFAQAQQLLTSGDPDVIQVLQGILSSTLQTGGIRLDGQPFDLQAMHSALSLLACDAGALCGPNTPNLLANCAYRGQCFANNLYEYSYFYENSPSQSQLVDSYRRSLAAMLNAGNFSGLTYSPTDSNSGFSMTFGRGKRGGG